jgi:hypothetical protein
MLYRSTLYHKYHFNACDSASLNAHVLFNSYRSKRRQISLYDSRDLMKELARVELDTAPSTLIPHVDADTGVCLLTSKVNTF